jgi:hypothetical protein
MLLLPVLLAGLVMACDGSRDPADPAPGGPSPAGGAGPGQGSGALSLEDDARIILAEEELISRCMADHGLTYHAVGPSVEELREQRLAEDQQSDDWFGSDDVERASRGGYGFADALDDPEPTRDPVVDHPNNVHLESLSPAERQAWHEALFGTFEDHESFELPGGGQASTATSGCLWEARDQLHGDAREYFRTTMALTDIGQQVTERVRADDRYQSAVAGWQACMRDSGHRFDSPAEAQNEIDALVATAPDRASARAREVAVSVADATCSREAGLAEAARDLIPQHREQVEAEFEGERLALQEMLRATLDRAREVLGVA